MNQFFSLLSLFGNLPRWLQTSIAVLTALVHLGIGVTLGPMVALIFAIGLLLVVILLGVYFFFIKQRRDRQRAALDGELGHNSLATPTAITERQQLEALGKIRNRFQEGLNKFRAHGKDIYKLPWYVVIGESGAGKSEIIRRSDVGFPPGMQEEMQGVGGTINMDWWFTNQAVLLDTAGRLLTDKVPAGASSEWKEFLKLLSKHRPNCPINGLLLVIPADSLIKDTPKAIEERAGWIARQLDNIQRELDIRFPVYVLISKCDLMNGFREFFETTDDPDSQRQMLGWSNPDPLDSPFRPEIVDQHLHTVVERLRRARLPLIQEPVPRDPARRRVEEVDRLFAFPNSVSLIADNLRRYLSIIFVSGEWSAKPLFLRGIYFTSSLREGSELDQELAEAIGVSVDELPEGRAWERDRPFFLRDLFLEKMFREWGLVTRASDTRQLLRRRKAALLGTGFAALTLLSLFSWLGHRTMMESIGTQAEYWVRAAEGWSGNTWNPVVNPDDGTYRGADPVGRAPANKVFDSDQALLTFHSRLKDRAIEPLAIAWVFRPFASVTDLADKKKQAQRIVLEDSLIQPLVAATRKKIIASQPGAAESERERDALFGLIKIEAGIVKRANKNLQIVDPKAAIAPLLTFTTKEQQTPDPEILAAVGWTYSEGGGKGHWPGMWLNGGETLKRDGSKYNEAIDVGLGHFTQNFKLRLAALEERRKHLADLEKFLSDDYGSAEQDLWRQAATARLASQFATDSLDAPYRTFEETRVKELGQRLEEADRLKLFAPGEYSLAAAWQRLRNDWATYLTGTRNSIDEALKELEFKELVGESRLLREIRERLKQFRDETEKHQPPELDEALLTRLRRLDRTYLTNPDTRTLVSKDRTDLYLVSHRAAGNPVPGGPYVTKEFAPIATIRKTIDQGRKKAAEYKGESATEFRNLCNYWLDYAERKQIDSYIQEYLKEARGSLDMHLRFPLVLPAEEKSLTDKGVLLAREFVESIRTDLEAAPYKEAAAGGTASEARRKLEQFEASLKRLDGVLRALVHPEGDRLKTFNISITKSPPRAVPVLPPGSPQPMLPDQVPTGIELRVGTKAVEKGAPHGALSDGGRAVEKKPFPLNQDALMAARVPIYQTFHAHMLPFTHGEPEHELGSNWVVLRLLLEKKATTTDGTTWEVNMRDDRAPFLAHEVILKVEFPEGPLPSFAEWPKRKDF